MIEKSLPKFFVFSWESACLFSSLLVSTALYVNTPILSFSDFFPLLLSQLGALSLLSLLTIKIKGFKKLFIITPFLLIFLLNLEHILINESNLNFRFYKLGTDSTFIDSIFTYSFLIHLFYFVTSMMISLIFSHYVKVKEKLVILIFIFSQFIQLILPPNPTRPTWARNSFHIENLKSFLQTNSPNIENIKNETSQELGSSFLSADRKNPKNIILILLEGFSQYHVETGLTPKLKKIQRDSFVLKNFVTHQKQTNRGLFSTLCGDFPNLLEFTAKSDLMISNQLQTKCLPHYLKELGYKNIFLQSAPLSFMGKDQFAKRVGYEFAVGANSFDRKKQISSWGVADEDIFSASLEILKDHSESHFLTLLTANTHHPYQTSKGRMNFENALKHIDQVVYSYIEELQKRKILENSLVIITSDEAFHSEKGLPTTFSNWGLMTILGKSLPQKIITEPFGQKDTLSSLLDFLKLKGGNQRSFFREYKNSETQIFSNIFQKRVYAYKDNFLLICNFTKDCLTKNTTGGIFSYPTSSNVKSGIMKTQLFDIIQRNDKSLSSEKNLLSFDNIGLKPNEERLIVSEYKITPFKNQARLMIEGQDVELNFFGYVCGLPSTMKNFEIQNQNLQFPKELLNTNLCISLKAKNLLNKEIIIKNISLRND